MIAGNRQAEKQDLRCASGTQESLYKAAPAWAAECRAAHSAEMREARGSELLSCAKGVIFRSVNCGHIVVCLDYKSDWLFFPKRCRREKDGGRWRLQRETACAL